MTDGSTADGDDHSSRPSNCSSSATSTEKIFLEFRAKRLPQGWPLARDPVEGLQCTHGVKTKCMCRTPQRQECRGWVTQQSMQAEGSQPDRLIHYREGRPGGGRGAIPETRAPGRTGANGSAKNSSKSRNKHCLRGTSANSGALAAHRNFGRRTAAAQGTASEGGKFCPSRRAACSRHARSNH